jgi:hypothetical protein
MMNEYEWPQMSEQQRDMVTNTFKAELDKKKIVLTAQTVRLVLDNVKPKILIGVQYGMPVASVHQSSINDFVTALTPYIKSR